MKNIENQGRVDFEYRLLPDGPKITATSLSNIVSTHILNYGLQIFKTSDKTTICIFDVITYTVEIVNIDDNNINNVFFQDLLTKDVIFYPSSIYVNGIQKRCNNPLEGFYIDKITSKEKIIITFKVLVISQNADNLIKNSATITFDYIYNIKEPPARIKACSNEVEIPIKDSIFKESNIAEIITIPDTMARINEIYQIKASINILKVKIYETPVALYKALKLNYPLRLLIIGAIKYKIEYIPSYCNNHEHFTRKLASYSTSRGFSISLMVPKGITSCNDIKAYIQVIQENLYYTLLSDNEVYINSTCIFKI